MVNGLEKSRAQEIEEMQIKFNGPTIRAWATIFFKGFKRVFHFSKTNRPSEQ